MNLNPIRVLLAEENSLRYNELARLLSGEGFKLSQAISTDDLLSKVAALKPQLIISDLATEHINGLAACRSMKAHRPGDALYVFLSKRTDEISQIAAFEAGADAFCREPIAPTVLIAQLHALINVQNRAHFDKKIKVGEISIDTDQRMIHKQGKEVLLSKKEYEMLCLLASKPGKIYSRLEIYKQVWGKQYDENHRTLDVHIRKLRKKIGSEYIRTMKGIGYGLVH